MIASPARIKAAESVTFCVKKKKKETQHMVSLSSIFIPVWEKPCRLLDARRTYSSALCVMDGDRSWTGGWICDFFFFHDIITVTLSWSEAFDLIGVGPYFGHPQPPYRLGMALIAPLFSDRSTDRPTCKTDPLALRLYLFLKYMLDVKGQLGTLWAKSKLLSL